MDDYKQLLADFDRWTGKGNLIQANQTAAKLFRLIFADREAITVTGERAGKEFLTEEAPLSVTQGSWVINNDGPSLTTGELETLRNDIEWIRAQREAGHVREDTVVPLGSTITIPEAVTPAEALAEAQAAPAEETPAKKTPAKKTAKAKDAD